MDNTQEMVVRDDTTTTPPRQPANGAYPTVTPSLREPSEPQSEAAPRRRAGIARRLLDAVAESGRPNLPPDVHLLVGANGGIIWTLTYPPSHDQGSSDQDSAR